MGLHAEDVRENLLGFGIPVSLIWLVLPREICRDPAMQRLKKILADARKIIPPTINPSGS
jgi:hypothetical protein